MKIKSRIICIGNRFVEEDCSGLEVYDRLLQKKIPENIELIEGGILGLNLLCFLENIFSVVFVDTVSGFTEPDQIILLNEKQIKSQLHSLHYGHDSGIPYLLTVLPEVCEGNLPQSFFMVGLEGPCSPATVDRAAALAISVATKHILSKASGK